LILLESEPLSAVVNLRRVLRTDRNTAGIPIIHISTAGRSLDSGPTPERGADVYLQEPLDPGGLIAIARRFIRAGSALRKLQMLSRTRQAVGKARGAAAVEPGASPGRSGGAATATAVEATPREAMERAAIEAERLLVTLENSSLGTWTYSSETGVFTTNRQAGELHGIGAGEVVDRERLTRAIHPDDAHRIFSFLDLHKNLGADFYAEARCPQPDGKVRWNGYRGRYVIDPLDGAQRWMGVVWNATAKKEVETGLRESEQKLEVRTFELRELNRRLLESNSDVQQFAGIIAHDLQSPLNAIILTVDELGRRITDPESTDALNSMMQSARRMHRLIRDVMDYSLAEWGGSRSFVAVDCNESVARTMQVLASEVRSSGSTVTWDKLPVVVGDTDQLASVFQNLIGNAIKYRKPGEAAHVHVAAVEREGEWLFSVRDDGIGIPPGDKTRIFRIFERLGHKPASGGAGIGLAICERVVERHGGRIWVESEPGNGSIFYFTLARTAAGTSL
jgi:PAS domain S-box-containing protein